MTSTKSLLLKRRFKTTDALDETATIEEQANPERISPEKENCFPLVSIGVPNYNYSQYVLQALDSVERQTYPNIELIVVDDCSTDNSVGVIERWIQAYTGNRKITFVKNDKNVGLTKICNQILSMAAGQYIQFLDADDTLLPHKIEKQVACLEKAPKVAFVYSDVLLQNDSSSGISYLQNIGYDRATMPSGQIHEQLFDFNFVPLPSVLVRTALIKEAGGFDETLAVQDYYLWLKLTEKHEAVYTHDYTATYRVHPGSMSNHAKTSSRSLDSILQTCFRYYKNSNKPTRKKIRCLLHKASPNLYKAGYPTALHWLKLDLLLNPGARTFVYFVGCRSGVPYEFFRKLKSVFRNRLQ